MKSLILALLKFYRLTISPSRLGLKVCRFEPSCSKYTYEAVSKYGILKGGILGFWRVCRCNPFSKGGYDPVK